MKVIAIIGIILIVGFALFGTFALFGGIRQTVINRLRKSMLERDIQKWEKLNRKYNRNAENK